MAQSGIATLLGWRGDVLRSGDLPPAPYVDPSAEALKAITGNAANLKDAAALGAATNTELLEQYQTLLRKLIPNWDSISGNVSKNIDAMSRGELPPDVQNMIQRNAAEMGVTTGTSGSDFDKYRSLRNLGLTSLQATDQALNSASRWMAAVTSGAPKYDFTKMFVSPELQIQNQWRNEENRWNVKWLGEQLDAQPSNAEKFGAQVMDYIATWATTAASAYSGGMGAGNNAPQQGGGGPYGGGSSWG